MRSLLKSKTFPSHSTLKQLSLAASSKSFTNIQGTIDLSLGKSIRHMRARKLLQKNSTKTILAWILLLIIIITENELHFQYGRPQESTILRLLTSMISVYMTWLVIHYYKYLFYMKILSKKIHKHTHIWDDTTFKYLLLEVLLTIIFLPPFVNASFRFDQLDTHNKITLDDLFVLIYMMRFYHIVKCVHHQSAYNTQIGHFFCKLVHKSYTVQFSIKAYIKDHPVMAISIGSFTLTILSGVLLRVFERTLPDSSFHDPWASLWVICVTQTTLGYGQYKPFSHMGRVICMSSCLFSNFLCSYLVMIFRIRSDLTTCEQKLMSKIIHKRALNTKSIGTGVVLIQKWWRFILKRKRKLPRFKEFIDLNLSCYKFKISLRSHRACKTLGLEHEIKSTQSSVLNAFLKASKDKELLEQLTAEGKKLENLEFEIMNKALNLRCKRDFYFESPETRIKNSHKNRIRMKQSISMARRKIINNFYL